MAAVDAVVENLIKLVDDGAHTDLGAFGLVATLQQLDTVRNKLPVVDRAPIQHGAEQNAPSVLSQRSMIGVVMTGLRLSAGEASRRVKAAEHLAGRHSQLDEPLDPIRGHLAAAQRDGAVTAEQVEAIDPDGILPADEAEHKLRRFFHLEQRRDGCWAGDFRLTPQTGQKLAALLDPLMNPRTTSIQPEDTDGVPGKKQTLPDERTQGQRRHDALEEILDAALRADELPATGRPPACPGLRRRTSVAGWTHRYAGPRAAYSRWVAKTMIRGRPADSDGRPVQSRSRAAETTPEVAVHEGRGRMPPPVSLASSVHSALAPVHSADTASRSRGRRLSARHVPMVSDPLRVEAWVGAPIGRAGRGRGVRSWRHRW